MVFNAPIFLVFFILFFLLYWQLNKLTNYNSRNIVTILASYLFYGWWDWRFLSLIIISSAADYCIGLWIHNSSANRKRKLLLICSLIINLGILGFFKYFNFFIESFNDVVSIFNFKTSLETLNIILPVGISFYTFQTLSYTIDIYKKKIKPTDNVISFFAFVSFFPQLVAGPIERASRLLKQFEEKKQFDYASCIIGLRFIIWGFFKKIVIADNFGALADTLLNPATSATGIEIFIGCIFFGFQIYGDFSGYSDIAIGTAKMLGFDLMTNFKTPFFAKTMNEFWHRWHISLSTWFRDYVYIPLGGNRSGTTKANINLMITFILSGLWHGAHITFVIWGFMHGLIIVLEKKVKLHKLTFLSWPIFFISLTILWIPFRAKSYAIMKSMILSLLDFNSYSLNKLIGAVEDFSTIRFSLLIIVTTLFFIVEHFMKFNTFSKWISFQSQLFRLCIYYSLMILIILLGCYTVKPDFIYFQF